MASAPGFKARGDTSLVYFIACMQQLLGFTSGVAPADLLAASMAAEPFYPLTCTLIQGFVRLSVVYIISYESKVSLYLIHSGSTFCSLTEQWSMCLEKELTRMHSSRMRTARLLPKFPSMHWGCTCLGGVPAWGVYLLGGILLGGVPARVLLYLPGGVPVQGGCTCLGGVPVWGMYLLGILPAWGVYLSRGCTCCGRTCLGDVPHPGGCAPVQGVYLLGEGVYLLGVCTCWGCICWGFLPRGCTCPGTPPPVNRILDTRYEKYYLALTVKMCMWESEYISTVQMFCLTLL